MAIFVLIQTFLIFYFIVMVRKIQDSNWGYSIIKAVVKFAFKNYYSSITIKGKENIPYGGRYIIAPNHQNAFLDALAVLYFQQGQIVFLSRADVFRRGWIFRLLSFLKIMPVYRGIDGVQNLEKNQEIFQKSVDALLDGVPLCLMAEGTHNNKHQLLPFQKGMFRIAFAAQKQLNKEPVFILPVGIDYDDYVNPGHALIINIGKPISVLAYMEQYKENEAIAINQLKEETFGCVSSVMHNIRTSLYYESFYEMSRFCSVVICKKEKLSCSAWNRFTARKAITKILDLLEQKNAEEARSLVERTLGFMHRCAKIHISPELVVNRLSVSELLLNTAALTLLFLFLGWKLVVYLIIAYPLWYLPTPFILKKIISDSQFVGPVNAALQLIFSIFYLPTLLIITTCLWDWQVGILFFVAGIVMWSVGCYIINWIKNVLQNWYYQVLFIFKNKNLHEIEDMGSSIVKFFTKGI